MLKEDSIDYDPETGRMRSPPRQLFLEVSSRCNLACVHCSRDFGVPDGHPELDLSWETVKRLTPWLEQAQHINLNMVGESLVSPLFDRIVELCGRTRAMMHFNTNGLLMTDRRCRHVIEHHVQSIVFSIDGLESNDPIRGVPYEAVKRRMIGLDHAKAQTGSALPLLGLSYVLMKRNLHELPRVLEDLVGCIRLQCIHVQPLVVFYETLRGENVYEQAGVDEVVARCREIAKRHGAYLSLFRSEFGQDERHLPGGEEAPQIGAKSERYGCTDPFYEIKIRSTGEVMSCSYGLVGGFDVNRMDLDEIWNGPWYRALRRRLYSKRFEGKCAGCPYIFGSARNQLDPVRPGVHHSQAERFLRGYATGAPP